MKQFLREVSVQTMGSLFAALILSLLFFLWSDFIFSPPRLSGHWYMVTHVDETAYKRYQGMYTLYEITAVQKGDDFSGTAEMVGEVVQGESPHIYDFEKRVRADFVGSINRRYLSRDVIELHWIADGFKRKTSTAFTITRFDNAHMAGRFWCTSASSKGQSEWARTLAQLSILPTGEKSILPYLEKQQEK